MQRSQWINHYGFIEAPYRKIDKATGKVTDEVVYMTADVEDEFIVAQANEKLNEDNTFANDSVLARFKGEFIQVDRPASITWYFPAYGLPPLQRR